MKEHYFVDNRACTDGIGLHLCPDVDRDAVRMKIAEMAVFSAPFTHPYGNRRLGDYVLEVKDRTVLRIRRIEGVPVMCSTCRDTKQITMWEECEACEGTGLRVMAMSKGHESLMPCRMCGGEKEIKRAHPCPDCSMKRPVSRLGFK